MARFELGRRGWIARLAVTAQIPRPSREKWEYNKAQNFTCAANGLAELKQLQKRQ